MALTPLEVEIIDGGAPVEGATIEVRSKLTGELLSPIGYDDQNMALSGPVLTDASGSAVIWEPNGIFTWQWSFDTFVSNPRFFRAYAGVGREALLSDTPVAPLPTTATLSMPPVDIDDALGAVRVALTFDHDHMGDVIIMLVPPFETTGTLSSIGLSAPATSGGNPLVGADVEFRDAVTLDPLVLADDASGTTPLGTPYLTGAGGNFSGGFHHSVVYQSRVPTSDNLTNWGALQIVAGVSPILWNGPENIGLGMSDFAFDGTVTFALTGQSNAAAFADGDTLGVAALEYASSGIATPATGTWTLWIAGGTAGTPGELAAWTLELVPV